MNKQELIKSLKFTRDSYSNEDRFRGGVRTGLGIALGEIEKLDEPEKVVIPKFVADAFEKAKGDNWFASPLVTAMYKSSDEVGYWLEVPSNEKLLLRAWLDDSYEIEKEKLYYVMNGQGCFMLLVSRSTGAMQAGNVTFVDALDRDVLSFYQLTEKQIKDYDERYWQFAVEVAE